MDERPYWAGFGHEPTRTTWRQSEERASFYNRVYGDWQRIIGPRSRQLETTGLILSAERAAVPDSFLGSSIVFVTRVQRNVDDDVSDRSRTAPIPTENYFSSYITFEGVCALPSKKKKKSRFHLKKHRYKGSLDRVT